MAKKAGETNLPLVISLVFFVLTTIGLGVFTYVLYSDQEGLKKAATDEQGKTKAARQLQDEADLRAKFYRSLVGVEDENDRKDLGDATGAKADVLKKEFEKFDAAAKNRLGAAVKTQKTNAPTLPASFSAPSDLYDWRPAADGKLPPAPAKTLLDGAVASYAQKELAVIEAQTAKKGYEEQVKGMAAAIKSLADEAQKFTKATADVPTQTKDAIDKFNANIKKAEDTYKAANKDFRTKLDAQADESAKDKVEIKKRDALLASQADDLKALQGKIPKQDSFRFDEPQGKVLRILPEQMVEIDLGSADKVRPGLTFTVLPTDFPQKGYQSRVRDVRVYDDEAQKFKSVQRFVPKGNLEVVEVLGPNLSKARMTSTAEIRDAVLPGDLLYNVAWRKGYSEHIALLGVFDTNGDGADDLLTVVRDLTNMGVAVDAYYDLAKRQWVGKVTEQTRFVVEGYLPNPKEGDPNLKAKVDLIRAVNLARDEATSKGVTKVSFRDFFPRTGYRVKLDVSDDRINQATSRYVLGVVLDEKKKPTEP